MNVKEALESEEGKKAIKEAVDEATKGLVSKRDELLDDLKKTKDSFKSLQAQIDEFKEAKEKAEEEAANKSGDVEKIKSALTDRHNKDLQKERDTNASLRKQLDAVLIDGGITSALVEAKVAPQFMDSVQALLLKKGKFEVTDVDGKPSATVDGKPIKEFVSTWAQSDQGKHYIAAAGNSGGGAKGSGGNGGAGAATTINRSEFNELSPNDQMKHVKAGGKVID